MTISFHEFQTDRVLPMVATDPQAVAPGKERRLAPPRRGIYRTICKRLLDITAILAAAPVVVPMVAAMAVMVARDGGRPFYSQVRVGRGGKPFRMWKLRSMVNDADERMEAYLAENPEARAEWDSTQKLRNDPRVTPVGQFLRKSSLDELPQLWNVLMGDMSLVGPRPHAIAHNNEFMTRIADYARRHHVKPGITGWAQVNGYRVETDTEEKMRSRVQFDQAYIDRWSLMFDVKIVLLTVLSRKTYRNAF